jgi:hypothetical protein
MRQSIRWIACCCVIGALVIAALPAQSADPQNDAASVQDKTLSTLQIFPTDDPWNRDISHDPIDPNSTALIAEIGRDKPLHPDWGKKYGIPFQLIDATTPRVSPIFEYADESDKGPYPIPLDPLIEGVAANGPSVDGDRHILCLDPAAKKLYELFHCRLLNGQWHCGSGAIFDLTRISKAQRPRSWTSADAAGLPIFPGLARYDEICIKKELTHALRFTVVKTRRAFVPPATHFASRSNDPRLPPMGLRVRLRADFDEKPFPPPVQVLLRGLKKFGLILADNGSDWFISGATDQRWDDEALHTLTRVKGRDLEVVQPESSR